MTRLALGEGTAWMENDQDATVTRVDLFTRELTATIPVAYPTADVAFGDGLVWVSVRGA